MRGQSTPRFIANSHVEDLSGAAITEQYLSDFTVKFRAGHNFDCPLKSPLSDVPLVKGISLTGIFHI